MCEQRCKNCGECLDNLPQGSSSDRPPCPKCGSKERVIDAKARSGIKTGDFLGSRQKREERTINFDEVRPSGEQIIAKEEKGEISWVLKSTSPQGEEATLKACIILIKKLNSQGDNWDHPRMGEDEVDCIAYDKNNAGDEIKIQVVRAITDSQIWKTLGKYKVVSESRVTISILVNRLKRAIGKKADVRKIPEALRKDLNLALDANLLAGITFELVVEKFRNDYGEWASSLGFKSIWLIGPWIELTSRLDSI